MKSILIAFIIMMVHVSAPTADTQYSNTQAGVKMRVLGYDTEMPVLRIENYGSETLAIRNDVYLAVSFHNADGTRVRAREQNLSDMNGGRQKNIDQIAIIGPGAAFEVPLRYIFFNMYEPGYGQQDNWDARGLRRVPPGTHKVRFTTNGIGISVLNVNFTPFKVNFDIPEFDYTVKE